MADVYQNLETGAIQRGSAADSSAKKPCCCGRLSRKQCGLLTGCLLTFFVAFGLVSAFVLVPLVAQATLDHANIEFTSLRIGEVHEGGAAFNTSVGAKMTNAGIFSATVAPMTMYVFYKGEPLGHVAMPKTEITGGQDAVIASSSVFHVANNVTFTAFSSDMVRLPSVDWHLEAECSLTAHMLGMSATLNGLKFIKDVQLTGLNGLRELKVLSSDPTLSDASGIKMGVQTLLTNPSIIEISPMGDLLFDIYYKGQNLGIMKSLDAELLHGDNRLNMTGYINPANPNDPKVTEVLSTMMAGKDIDLQAVGAQEGASSIALFAPSLAGLSIDAAMSVPFKPVITSVELPHVRMTMHPEDPERVTMQFDALASIESPLGPNCPINVHTVGMNVELMTLEKLVVPHISTTGKVATLPGSRLLGTTATPIVSVQGGDTPTLSFSMTSEVQLAEPAVFGSFAKGFVDQKTSLMLMQGGSNVSMGAANIPAITANNVPFQNVVAMPALDHLKDVKLEILQVYLMGGSKENGVETLGVLKMNNPSPVAFDLGPNSDLYLDVYYQGVMVGYSKVSQFILNEGDNINTYPMNLQLVKDSNIVQGLLSDYLMGKDSQVTVKGRSSVYPFMSGMLQQMVLETTMHGQKDALIPKAIMHVPSLLHPKTIPTELISYNPFNTTMEIIGYNTDIILTSTGEVIGLANDTFPDNPIVLKPGVLTTTRKLSIVMTGFNFKAITGALAADGVDLSMNGTLTTRIGTFEATVFYYQTGCMAKLDKNPFHG